ncbi:MAG: LytS/YhcK type 5TM receptor domain-containing protein [Halobacteriota archaeon]
MLGDYLSLFAATETFIYVFMEMVSKLETIQRVVFKEARLRDYIVFTVLFGFFSIFGTYAGTQSVYGSFVDIRDLAPIVAGLVAGPYVGLAVGLIGGLHRLVLGGAPTYVACSLTTMVAGLLAGVVYRLNKEKLEESFRPCYLPPH